VDRQVEHPLDLAGTVAAGGLVHVPDDHVDDVVAGDHPGQPVGVVEHREPGDAVFPQEVDDLPDVGVLPDSDDVLGVDLLDSEGVEVLDDRSEDGVLGDDTPELLALEHRCHLRPTLDEDAGDPADVGRPLDLRRRADHRTHLRVVLDVGLHQLLLRDDAGVLAALGDDDALGVLALEDGTHLPESLVGVDLDKLSRGNVRNVHRASRPEILREGLSRLVWFPLGRDGDNV